MRDFGDTGRVSRKFQLNQSTLKFSLARGPGEGAGEAELAARQAEASLLAASSLHRAGGMCSTENFFSFQPTETKFGVPTRWECGRPHTNFEENPTIVNGL